MQETIQDKIKEAIQKEYEELKDEENKIKNFKLNELNNDKNEIEAKIKKVENEINYNLKSQNLKNFSNFIKTK